MVYSSGSQNYFADGTLKLCNIITSNPLFSANDMQDFSVTTDIPLLSKL
jgi:hypothetical protein